MLKMEKRNRNRFTIIANDPGTPNNVIIPSNCQSQQKDRPPPVRTLDEKAEEGYDSYASEGPRKELDDPYIYTSNKRKRTNRICQDRQ